VLHITTVTEAGQAGEQEIPERHDHH
jgi:hypothetical protein